MKTDLKSMRKELNKLTDIKYLKKEINRIANEIRKFDLQMALTPAAKETLQQLESRFRELVAALSDLQKQVDSSLDRLVTLVRTTTTETEAKIRAKVGLGTKSKTTVKKARKVAKKTAKKVARKVRSARSTVKKASK